MSDSFFPEDTNTEADIESGGKLTDSIEAISSTRAVLLAGEDFSVMSALGGVRGILEGIVPGLVFVIGFVITRALFWPLVGALGIAVVFIIMRVFFAHSSALQAISGMAGVLIGVAWAALSGKGEDFFVYSLWINLIYLVGLLISLLLRWPLAGVIMGILRSQGANWRNAEHMRADRKAYYVVTTLWAVMFALRLVVKFPLYLQANVAWLGAVHLAMGLPLTAFVLWLSWMLLRRRGKTPVLN